MSGCIHRTVLTLFVLMAVSLLFWGCGPSVKEQAARDEQAVEQVQPPREDEVEAEPEVTYEAEAYEEQEATTGPAEWELTEFPNIHFDFDKSDLKPVARDVLNTVAFAMIDHPTLSLVIEGHCDERGSNEYNLALGERRARAAKGYLIELGVEPHRITIRSYGEEVPLDFGHTEEAWARNRRDQFIKVVEE